MFVRVLYELFLNIFFFERRITRGNDRSRLLLCEYTVVFLKGLNNVVLFRVKKSLDFWCVVVSQEFFHNNTKRHKIITRILALNKKERDFNNASIVASLSSSSLFETYCLPLFREVSRCSCWGGILYIITRE